MAAPITLRLMTVWGAEQKEHLALLAEYSQINPDVEIVHEVMAGAGAALYRKFSRRDLQVDPVQTYILSGQESWQVTLSTLGLRSP